MTDAASTPLAAALARSERRRQRLEELSEIGMSVARELQSRVLHGDRLKEEVAPAFDRVSRAVRLSLAMEERLEDRILALSNGDLPAAARPLPAPAVSPFVDVASQAFAFIPGVREAYHAANNARLDAIVAAAEARHERRKEAEDGADAEDRPDHDRPDRERLVDQEDREEFPFVPFEESVLAICRGLGVDPHSRFLGEGAGPADAPPAAAPAPGDPVEDLGYDDQGSAPEAVAPAPAVDAGAPEAPASDAPAAAQAPASRLHRTIPALE